MNNEDNFLDIHKRAIIIDAACPLGNIENNFNRWITGGVTVMAPTVASDHGITETMQNIGRWLRLIENNEDKLKLVTSVDDIYKAKKQNKLGILFHFQDTLPLESKIELLSAYRNLGVRVIQLCYNVKNFIGDGCEERTDSGLSDFGIQVIKEMNRLGILVDLTHAGYQTSLEAMQISEKPVIFSHSNVYNLCPSSRNIRDEQIKCLADKGGVIGVVGYPAFVKNKPKVTLDDLIDHIDYIRDLVGIEHVGLGIDYWEGMDGIASIEEAHKLYNDLISLGRWKKESYPEPPWTFPQGIETPEKFPNLTRALLRRGYSETEIELILGKNYLRVYNKVW